MKRFMMLYICLPTAFAFIYYFYASNDVILFIPLWAVGFGVTSFVVDMLLKSVGPCKKSFEALLLSTFGLNVMKTSLFVLSDDHYFDKLDTNLTISLFTWLATLVLSFVVYVTLSKIRTSVSGR
jgi:hypothetical protein